MGSFKLLWFFVCFNYVLCGVSILDPCNKDDVACLRESTKQFLEGTKRGIPQFNIEAIDPFIIPSMDILEYSDLGFTLHCNNLNVTGMNNMNVHEFQIDSEKKRVRLDTNVYLNVNGDIVLKLVSSDKKYSGTISSKGPANVSFSYEYGVFVKDGVEHFVVYEETILCDSSEDRETQLSPGVLKAFESDEYKSIISKISGKEQQIRKESFCKVAKEAYRIFINNIRLAAQNLPKTAFFKDI